MRFGIPAQSHAPGLRARPHSFDRKACGRGIKPVVRHLQSWTGLGQSLAASALRPGEPGEPLTPVLARTANPPFGPPCPFQPLSIEAGSTLTPRPPVEETATFRTNLPFAPARLALATASAPALLFSPR